MHKVSIYRYTLLVSLALSTVPVVFGAASDDCVPISPSGAQVAGQSCCVLSPFNSICTSGSAAGDSGVKVVSTPAANSILSSLPSIRQYLQQNNRTLRLSSLNNVTNSHASVSDAGLLDVVEGDMTKTVVLTPQNPEQSFFIVFPDLLTISGDYTLISFGDVDNSFAVNGRITTSQPLCTIDQMIGSLGVPQLFQKATCVKICSTATSDCAPFTFCGVQHPNDPNAVYFGLRQDERLLQILYFTTSDTGTVQFGISEAYDCLSGGGGSLETIGGTVGVLQDPATNGYVLAVTFASWGGTGIGISQTQTNILKFGSSSSPRRGTSDKTPKTIVTK